MSKLKKIFKKSGVFVDIYEVTRGFGFRIYTVTKSRLLINIMFYKWDILITIGWDV